MSGTLKDLMDQSFEIHADRTAVRILRQADQQAPEVEQPELSCPL